jgi:hypothetical protein
MGWDPTTYRPFPILRNSLCMVGRTLGVLSLIYVGGIPKYPLSLVQQPLSFTTQKTVEGDLLAGNPLSLVQDFGF